MTCLRFRGWTSLALLLALAPSVWAEQPLGSYDSLVPAASTAKSAECSYKIYSLDGLGSDAGFGEWIAQTIPDVIATGTWKGPGVIRYYAPKNVLVVNHTPEVQTKVAGFLKDMKKALPTTKKAAAGRKRHAAGGVVPASYQEPSVLRGAAPVADSSVAYPIPAQARTPKHLFHFIIRYEGQGLVDDNIVKAMKAYYVGEKKASEVADRSLSSSSAGGAATPAVSSGSSAMGTSLSTLPSTAAPAASSGFGAAAPATLAEKEDKKDTKKESKKEEKKEEKDREKKSESPLAP